MLLTQTSEIAETTVLLDAFMDAKIRNFPRTHKRWDLGHKANWSAAI